MSSNKLEDFQLPILVDKDGKEVDQKVAWKEYEQWALCMDTAHAISALHKQNKNVEIICSAGVELLDEVYYDPTSTTVGIWSDKKRILRGAAPIRFRRNDNSSFVLTK